jgi:putative ABC transport system ATP-binding protein
MTTDLCIDARGVHRSFGSLKVLQGIDLTVHVGEIVALYGPSGSGKTTLLNLIGALDRPQEGEIEVLGQPITRLNDSRRAKLRRTAIGFIFQSSTLLPTYTAAENIDLALRLPGIGHRERKRRTETALQAVGLSAWTDHLPEELSGGQRQRVSIARALALQGRLILADEPTSGLDTATTRGIMALFRAIAQQQDTTFLMVTHNPLIVEFVDSAYDLSDGLLAARQLEPPAPSPEAAKEQEPCTV